MASDFQSLFLHASAALARLQEAHEREVAQLQSEVVPAPLARQVSRGSKPLTLQSIELPGDETSFADGCCEATDEGHATPPRRPSVPSQCVAAAPSQLQPKAKAQRMKPSCKLGGVFAEQNDHGQSRNEGDVATPGQPSAPSQSVAELSPQEQPKANALRWADSSNSARGQASPTCDEGARESSEASETSKESAESGKDSVESAMEMWRAQQSEQAKRLTRKEREHHQSATVEDIEIVVTEDAVVARIVDSFAFEAFTGMMIFVNCVFVGVEVQSFAESHAINPPLYIDVVGYIIFGVFFLELILRIVSRGPMDFFLLSPTTGWSWFDALVVAMSTVDLLLTVLVHSSASSTSVSNVRVFRVIKVARLMRIVRVARILRYASALRMLIYSITVSLKSVMWALLLFFLIIYIFGVIFTQEMVQSIVDDPDVAGDDVRLYYWSSIYSAMFTLFKSICGGVSWQEAVEPLLARHVVLACLFAVYIWFTYFVALNVITGAFCSSATAAAANDPEMLAMGIEISKEKRVQHAKRVFKAIDLDASGYVTIGELKSRISDSDVQGLLLAIGIEIDDAYSLFSVMDADNSGLIDLDEFVSSCMSLRGAVSNVEFVRAATETRWIMKRLVKITECLEALPRALAKTHSGNQEHSI